MKPTMIDAPETLLGLVEHYSPSGDEAGAVAWLVQRMRTLGFAYSHIDKTGNAVGIIGDGPKQIVLLGHIDTVPGEIPVRLEDGILYGRGAVDAKGPLACFVDAAVKIQPPPGWQIIVIGAVEEERSSAGARAVAPLYHPDFAVIGEPNQWDQIALGYKGNAGITIRAEVEQFHSARQQDSACEVALGSWIKLKEFSETFNQGKEKVFEQLSLSLQGWQSGMDGFKQWAQLSIGARLPVDLRPEVWYEQAARLCPRVQITQNADPIPAWKCEKNTPLVRAMLSAIRANGGQPGFVYKTGTADLNIVAPVWQCPALVYGPGDSRLDHTPDEKISIEEYQKAVAVLSTALGLLMTPAD
jgi:[amino group carrier protein]-lysine/ornithine hydrolase